MRPQRTRWNRWKRLKPKGRDQFGHSRVDSGRMAKRASGPSGTPEKSADCHGAFRYVRTSPDVVQKGVKSPNVEMELGEAS
jgi:hypothetical protein